MNNELFARLSAAFGKVLPAPAMAILGPESNMDNTEGWDSLNFLELILEIEKEFHVRIDGLDAANMVSVANILSYLEARVEVNGHA